MNTYKVIVCSSIFYEVEVDADDEKQVYEMFKQGRVDFTGGQEIDLESYVYEVKEI